MDRREDGAILGSVVGTIDRDDPEIASPLLSATMPVDPP
jgi:hypothetical protein